MKTWQKVGLLTLAVVLFAGVRFYFVWKSRQDPGVVVQKGEPTRPMTKDELADVKLLFLTTYDSAKQLEGMTVWMKAGYSLPYYPFAGGRVDFPKRVGLLPAAEKLQISKLLKAVAPAKENNRIPHGTRQYFVVFTLANKTGTFAAPIGAIDSGSAGANEVIYADQLFYYDDPRKIYDHWPQGVWDAVATHTPRVGLTENQTRMAVGIMQESDSKEEGERTVTYDLDGKKWTVTFAKGVATAVKAG